MTGSSSPAPADLRLAAVLEATQELGRAAAAGDADAIDRAVAARGAALEQLTDTLTRFADMDAASRSRILALIAIETEAASAALQALVGAVRTEMATLAEGAHASRGYASPANSGSLDRAG